MSSNREQWLGLLADLDQRQAQAEAMGGEEKIARQHQKGRLTARERLALLFDPGTFNEIGALAGGNHPGGEPALAGDGVVGGTGLVNGRSAGRGDGLFDRGRRLAGHTLGGRGRRFAFRALRGLLRGLVASLFLVA